VASATGRTRKGRKVVESVLLGLHDAEGLLHHGGFSSAIKTKDKPALTDRLGAVKSDRSFTGNAPGGPGPMVDEAIIRMAPHSHKNETLLVSFGNAES
jgi:ATP-dependent DNA ligase